MRMDDLGEARGRRGADAVTRAVGRARERGSAPRSPHCGGRARRRPHRRFRARPSDSRARRDARSPSRDARARAPPGFRELLDGDIAQRFRHDDPSAEAAGDQAVGRGARLLGDPSAGEHARDLLAPRRSGKLLDLGSRQCGLAAARLALAHAPVMGAARGDLGRVGDDKDLELPAQALQPFADRRRGRAADAAIHLVEHQRRRRGDARAAPP